MFDGISQFPLLPPFPPDPTSIGPGGQFVLFLVSCFSLAATAYFCFELCALMWEEVPRDIERLRAHRVGKKWQVSRRGPL